MGALRAEDWTAIGALTAAGVVAISCLLVVARLSQRAHIRTRRSQREAGIWSSLAEVAQRINDGDPLARMGMTALIADRSTRRFAIEKLADMVRSMPETSLEGWCSRSTLRRIEGWVRKELKESDSGRRANCVEIVGTLKLVSCVGLLASNSRCEFDGSDCRLSNTGRARSEDGYRSPSRDDGTRRCMGC